jgi:hypothetical protein
MLDDEYVGELDWDQVPLPSSTGQDNHADADTSRGESISKAATAEIIDYPHAIQIVSIGSESDAYAFTFHEDSLNHVLGKIQPSSMKVCVISVVGAFRTGKSFLLSWFLRYLHFHSDVIGSANDGNVKWYEESKSLGNDGFNWRGGSERNTTGIWMWSHPFILPSASNNDEKIAVLLVDTQGLFYNYVFQRKIFSTSPHFAHLFSRDVR